MNWILLEQVGLIVLAVVGVVFAFLKVKPDAQVEDSAPMPIGARRVLVWFLIVLGVSVVYALVKITAAEFPEAAWETDVRAEAKSGSKAADSPVLKDLLPQTNVNPSIIDFSVFGENFTKESVVRFKGQEKLTTFYGPQRLQTQLDVKEIVGLEPIVVDVINPAKKDPADAHTGDAGGKESSNAIAIVLKKTRAEVRLFGCNPMPITRELQLLLLALLAGAIGSYLHALQSLSDFIGNRTLTASWFWWYITRPFLGMAMALIFYAVLRGGFLTGTPADAKVVNPFGVLAIGALVGMFADKASQKLADVFDTLFKASDPRGGKLAAPVIDKLDPDTVRTGGKEPVVLRIIGDRMGKVSKVRLNEKERQPDKVSEQQVTVTLTTEDIAATRDISVTVVDPEAGASPAATLHVTDLAITGAGTALPEGTVASDYTQAVSASGGTIPYKWVLASAPAWLTLDAKAGTLAGKPTASGPGKVVVKVVDKAGASASATFDLNVKPG